MLIEEEIKKVSEITGYSYEYLMDIVNEHLKVDGYVDLDYIRCVSMEQDW